MAYTKQGSIGTSKASTLIAMNQTHSNTVALIQSMDGSLIGTYSNGRDASLLRSEHANALAINFTGSVNVVAADACITCETNVLLSVKTGDCLPILLDAYPYVAVIHAGREGTIHQITYQVCQILKERGVSGVNAWFGPASCLFCYQIDRDTNTYFDLVGENQDQLQSVFHSNVVIDNSEACTQCESHLYYSYRSGDQVNRNVFYISKMF
jgi:copper oxidase (laccase) domain-containing protein